MIDQRLLLPDEAQVQKRTINDVEYQAWIVEYPVETPYGRRCWVVAKVKGGAAIYGVSQTDEEAQRNIDDYFIWQEEKGVKP